MQSFRLKLQDLKNYLNLSNTKILGVGSGLGVVLVAIAAYSFLKQKQTQKTNSIIDQEQPTFGQIYTEAIKAVTQALGKYNGLSNQVIKQIIRSQYKLAGQEYVELFLKLRQDRRQVINDKHQYSKLILSIDQQIQILNQKHLNAILAHFQIERTYWIEAVQMWTTQSEENKQQWEVLLFDMEHEQLLSLRKSNKQPLKLKNLLQIIDFKLMSLQTYDQNSLQISNPSVQQQQLRNSKYTLIDTYISDLVFKKFGVQEEDIIYSVQKLGQKDKDTYETHEDQFTDLMRRQIFGEQYDQDEQEDWEDEQESQSSGDVNDQEA